MTTRAWLASLMAVYAMTGCGHDHDHDHDGDPEGVTMGRLLVAHATEPTVWVWDLDGAQPTLVGTLTTTGPASLYAEVHGRYAYAMQRDDDVVHIIDQGILLESHGDHFDIFRRDPSVLETRFEGAMPTHFTRHQGNIAVFYDGSGDVEMLLERSLSAGGTPTRWNLQTGVAHHGLAITAFGHVLASLADAPADPEERARPDRVGVWEIEALDGAPESEEGPCPGLHGQTAGGEYVLFGCADGVLVAHFHDDHFDFSKIDNPPTTPEGTRVGSLWSHGEVFVGNWGNDGLVRINPATGTFGTPVTLPARQRGVTFDMHGEHLLVLTVDGNLHRLELDLSPAGDPLAVMDAFDATATPRPQISVGANRVYVSDPAASRVREVHTEDWEIEREITLPAAPGSIVALSVSPDFEEDHDGHSH